MVENIFFKVYINNFIKVFRRYNTDRYVITINGLSDFIDKDCKFTSLLLEKLALLGFIIKFDNSLEIIDCINISCKKDSDDCWVNTYFRIQDISSIIELSSKTDIPLVCLIIMKSVAKLICEIKILYKAIVLDLDDTLWAGTLSEIGIEQIEKNLNSSETKPFIYFMKFIKSLAKDFGFFVAICSRNDIHMVQNAIDSLSDTIFPIKNYIDCIIANNNDKSENIKLISDQLSILPDSIIFVDDNYIVRNEVRENLPNVFVPDWDNHYDLVTMLITGCFFERNILSVDAQKRKIQFKMIMAERSKNTLPVLEVKINDDISHIKAIELYTKSNQFNFSQFNKNFGDDAQSLYFELYRENGDSLGICSALTYVMSSNAFTILNWAISCRFFEIGLEEFILMYIKQISQSDNIIIKFQDSHLNQKVKDLLIKYQCVFDIHQFTEFIDVRLIDETMNILSAKTNLKIIKNG